MVAHYKAGNPGGNYNGKRLIFLRTGPGGNSRMPVLRFAEALTPGL